MLVGLCVLSIPWIRTNFYSLFYRLYIPFYIAYLGLMFWHADQELDSWAYLWATLALYLASVAARAFIKWQTFNVLRPWFLGFPAIFTPLPGGMTKIDVLVPFAIKWKPGQHCWLRFPALSLLQNHPFTIASLPTATADGRTATLMSTAGDNQRMTFYIRSYSGLTRQLSVKASEKAEESLVATHTVHIDGPYGGIIQDLPALYDELIFVAGGGGISACIPLMLHAALRISKGTARVASIRLVWMARRVEHLQWVRAELGKVARLAGGERVAFDFYVTGDEDEEERGRSPNLQAGSSSDDDGAPEEKPRLEAKATIASDLGVVHKYRPYLVDAVPEMMTARTVMVFGKLEITLSLAYNFY
jgi:NAD(P)H-flavin reductase